jgi:phosphatidate cytidylyltransferase
MPRIFGRLGKTDRSRGTSRAQRGGRREPRDGDPASSEMPADEVSELVSGMDSGQRTGPEVVSPGAAAVTAAAQLPDAPAFRRLKESFGVAQNSAVPVGSPDSGGGAGKGPRSEEENRSEPAGPASPERIFRSEESGGWAEGPESGAESASKSKEAVALESPGDTAEVPDEFDEPIPLFGSLPLEMADESLAMPSLEPLAASPRRDRPDEPGPGQSLSSVERDLRLLREDPGDSEARQPQEGAAESEVAAFLQESLGSLETEEVSLPEAEPAKAVEVAWRDEPEQWETEDRSWQELTAEWAKEAAAEEGDASEFAAEEGDASEVAAGEGEASRASAQEDKAEAAAEEQQSEPVRASESAEDSKEAGSTEQEAIAAAATEEGFRPIAPDPFEEAASGAAAESIEEQADTAPSALSASDSFLSFGGQESGEAFPQIGEEEANTAGVDAPTESLVGSGNDAEEGSSGLRADAGPVESAEISGREAEGAAAVSSEDRAEEEAEISGEEKAEAAGDAGRHPRSESAAAEGGAMRESITEKVPPGAPQQLEPAAPGTETVTEGAKPRSLALAVAVGLAVGGVALGLMLAGPGYFAVLVAAICFVGIAEYVTAVRKSGFQPAALVMLLGAGLTMTATAKQGLAGLGFGVAVSVIASAVWYIAGIIRISPVANLAATVFGYLYVAVPASVALLLLGFPGGSELWRGHVTFLVLTSVAVDVGGYLGGSRFGKHFVASKISPKKSLEGYLVALVFACAVGAAMSIAGRIFDNSFAFWTPARAAVGVGLVYLFSTAGDLSESLLKRSLGVKDMSGILPGHGGILDRFDSLLAAVPAFWIYLHVIGSI